MSKYLVLNKYEGTRVRPTYFVPQNKFKPSLYVHSFISSIQPLGRFSWKESPVRLTVWLWHAASWANS